LQNGKSLYINMEIWQWHGEREGSCQVKRKLKNTMEAMLQKSLGASDSEIQGVRDCHSQFRGDEFRPNACLPGGRGGGRPEACTHLPGIHHDKLWLWGFLSVIHPRIEATLVPYRPEAHASPDNLCMFLHVIHNYNYHNILISCFSWRFQSLRDFSGSKGQTFPNVFQMCGIHQSEIWDIEFRLKINFRFLIVEVSRISMWYL